MRDSLLRLELLLMFIIVPLFFFFYETRILMVTLTLVAIYALILLLTDKDFDRKQLWNYVPFKKMKPIFARFVLGSAILIMLVGFFSPDKLFYLPLNKPIIWIMIMVGYPVISVYPQELIYRAFFMQRYKPIVRSTFGMIVSSTALFGYMHFIFDNFVAIGLTLIGGYMFSKTYLKTKSLYAVFIEHSLYGMLLFTIGLGHFFMNVSL